MRGGGIMIKLWWHRLITRRVATKLVSYNIADEILNSGNGWELAKEEDDNFHSDLVYLERRESIFTEQC